VHLGSFCLRHPTPIVRSPYKGAVSHVLLASSGTERGTPHLRIQAHGRVDALEIQEIEDSTGYIKNLAAPHAANIASQARIAQARADQEATQRELEAAAMKAQFERDTEIKRAGYLAETEEAKSRAAQAGPLAQAKASQEVIQQQTVLAQRQAELAAQQLEAEVRRPADAEAYRKRTLAEADGFARRALAEAEADANKVRAASLRDGNQELIAASQMVEMLPQIVDATARGLAGSNLTVLNGTEGVGQMMTGIVAQGMAVLDTLRTVPAVADH
jgi:uncharacterized membrane protein YqiK